MSDLNQQYDIVIVGGGLIGMSMAAALSDSPCSILLLEQNQTAPVNANKLDLRTTGLTRSSEKVFAYAGLWDKLSQYATPIERMEISEQGNFGVARIDSHEHQISPIGYMLPNHQLMSVLSSQVQQQENLTVLAPASLIDLSKSDQGHEIKIDHDGKEKCLQVKLVIGSDGGNSKVRSLLGIGSEHKLYQQKAIVTNVRPQLEHNNIAFERFTAHGPLAVLPTPDNYCALIWTQPEDKADHYLELSDENFLRELQQAFGFRLGKFLEVGKRSGYPLSLSVSNRLTSQNAVLIGNAGQAVHPVAAQGFNLGLRDVQTLAELLKQAEYNYQTIPSILKKYATLRMPDRDNVIRLTDGLTRLFAPQFWPMKIARSLGVRLIGSVPFAQRSILQHNLGYRYLFGVTE
ncbi:MAG: UbiH/UbiF/VisC/COQ6 family ubiquinone biosynthesis hydroxylase [Pseudomonadota bacterium]